MDSLTYNLNSGYVRRDDVVVAINKKPFAGSIKYEDIYYEPATDNLTKVFNGITRKLSKKDINLIKKFIKEYEFPVESHYVTADGVYAGFGVMDNHVIVDSAPPTDGNYHFVDGAWAWILAVDKNGVFVGNVAKSNEIIIVPSTPDDKFQKWDLKNKAWTETRSLKSYLKFALPEIDKAISIVRQKYITVTDGQPEVYNDKVEEATNYIKDIDSDITPNLDNYPILNAEAEERDISIDEMVSIINTKMIIWAKKRNEIEIMRMSCKIRISKCTDVKSAKLEYVKSIINIDIL